jgi:hypothetical protein
MAHEMSQLRATANEHLRRDTEAGGKWLCTCQACQQIRSLVGMEKTLEVRPLVREIQEIEEQLTRLQDGPDRRSVLNRYFKLYDQLAEVMAKS